MQGTQGYRLWVELNCPFPIIAGYFVCELMRKTRVMKGFLGGGPCLLEWEAVFPLKECPHLWGELNCPFHIIAGYFVWKLIRKTRVMKGVPRWGTVFA